MRAPDAQPSLAATRTVRARMLPLLVLLVFVVSLSAPLAMYLLHLGRLRQHTGVVGARVADLVAQEARHHPQLWRYNTHKLVGHVQEHEHQVAIHRIVITDAEGVPVTPLDPARVAALGRASLLWSAAPIRVGEHRVGTVWVATSATGARDRFFAALGGFAVIALALGLLIYRIPLRTLARAEAHTATLLAELEQSRADLAALNQSLEQRIRERAADLATANQELRDRERRLRELSARATAFHEAERRAIARELHDGVGQALTALRINLQLLSARAGEADYVRARAETTLDLADGILEEVRRAVRTLGPAIVAEVGLRAAVKGTCQDFAERTGARMGCVVDPLPDLPTATENACYRILQEALTNAARHANAQELRVTLGMRGPWLHLQVTDDGQGFAPDELPVDHEGRGLAGIRERVELLGGRLTLTAAPGQGTTVEVELPGPPEPQGRATTAKAPPEETDEQDA